MMSGVLVPSSTAAAARRYLRVAPRLALHPQQQQQSVSPWKRPSLEELLLIQGGHEQQQPQQQSLSLVHQHYRLPAQTQPHRKCAAGIFSRGGGHLLLFFLLLPRAAEVPSTFISSCCCCCRTSDSGSERFAAGCGILHAAATSSPAGPGAAAAACYARRSLQRILSADAAAASPPVAAASRRGSVASPAVSLIAAAAAAASAAAAVSPTTQLTLQQPTSFSYSTSRSSNTSSNLNGSNRNSSNSETMASSGEEAARAATKATATESSFTSAEDVVIGLVTCKDKTEGEKVAETLVAQQLVACVNILPGVRSIYMWKGEMQKDEEVLLLLKTRKSLQPQVTAAVVQAHSYDVPEVIFSAITGGYSPYLKFLRENTAQ